MKIVVAKFYAYTSGDPIEDACVEFYGVSEG